MRQFHLTDLRYSKNSDLITQIDFAFLVQEYRKLGDGGFQIISNMFDLHPNAFIEFKEMVLPHIAKLMDIDQIQEWRIFGNRNNEITEDNLYHAHPGFDFGGVYYVQTPGQGGELEFKDPSLVITPYPGLLMIFDAKYEHRVKKYNGFGRYSIGMNIKLKN